MTIKASFSVVGPGKLGCSLGSCLQQSGHVTIQQICGRDLERVEAARSVIGAGEPIAAFTELVEVDYLLLSVPDDCIAGVARDLAKHAPILHDTVVFHASGLLDSSCLQPLADLGAKTASLHPVLSFSGQQLSLADFANTCCAIEGDPSARARLHSLFSDLGARCFAISAAAKPRYHAALALMANYTVTLRHLAEQLLSGDNITPELAHALLQPLLASVTQNLDTMTPADALTGPIQRGDVQAVKKHLEALPNGKLKEVYRLLGELTVSELASCDDSSKQQLLDVLSRG